MSMAIKIDFVLYNDDLIRRKYLGWHQFVPDKKYQSEMKS